MENDVALEVYIQSLQRVSKSDSSVVSVGGKSGGIVNNPPTLELVEFKISIYQKPGH